MALDPIALAKPLADYFDFLSEFIPNPSQAMASHRGRGKVEAALVLNVGLAVLFAWVVALVREAVGLPAHEGRLGDVIGKLDITLSPLGLTFVILPSIYLYAAGLHAYGTVSWRITKGKNGFTGKLADSFNATCAFASFFIVFLPLLDIYIEVCRTIGASGDFSTMIILALFYWAANYLPRALAAVHLECSINPWAYSTFTLFLLVFFAI